MILRTENIHKIYPLRGENVHAVKDVSIDIPARKMTAIVGRSGSGKTTLLNLLTGLDTPTEGQIWFQDQLLSGMKEQERLLLRREKIGFVFQGFGLLPLLSATENVGVPLRMRRMDAKERESRVQEALDWVGLAERAKHRPYELSGGEQQRVAIARALASRPALIMADEPTGQLDSITGQKIIDLLRRVVEERQITAVIVTHDPKVMRAVDLVYEMQNGQVTARRVQSTLQADNSRV